MIEDREASIKLEQLTEWGLIGRVKREKLIDNFLISQEYPSIQQKKDIFSAWKKMNAISDNSSFNKWKKDNGLSDLELKAIIFRNWRWEQWCKNNFKDMIPSYYLERKILLDQVSYSILRVKKKTLAQELFLRINEGESSFEEIASKYSEGPERDTFGKVGPVSMNQPHPKLARLLQISKPGQLWAPKELEGWWIIAKLNKIITTEFNEMIHLKLALELGEKEIEKKIHLN